MAGHGVSGVAIQCAELTPDLRCQLFRLDLGPNRRCIAILVSGFAPGLRSASASRARSGCLRTRCSLRSLRPLAVLVVDHSYPSLRLPWFSPTKDTDCALHA